MHKSWVEIQSQEVKPVDVRTCWQFERDLEFEKVAKGKTLVVGCNEGLHIFRYDGQIDIVGIDQDRYETWKKAPEKFHQVKYQDLSQFSDNEFETVYVTNSAIYYAEDSLKALIELRRVCGGKVYLNLVDCSVSDGMRRSNLLFNHYEDIPKVNYLSYEQVKDMVVEAGFEIESSERLNPINVWPLIAESLVVPGLTSRVPLAVGSRVFNLLFKPKYFYNCWFELKSLNGKEH